MITDQVKKILDLTFAECALNIDGALANYIPELANVNSNLFAICYTGVDGSRYNLGETDCSFTAQSTSKPLVYGLALNQRGSEFVHSKVGVEPTGEAFNSIIELEEKSHRPYNPMINSGAIATSSLILGEHFQDRLDAILAHFQAYVGHAVAIDEKVYESERNTAHRNRAIAYLMKHFSVMEGDIEETLNLYFKQCSILLNCSDLSMIAATLANQGVQPLTQQQVIDPQHVKRILSLMFTCGMYDTAGEWAFRVGLPAKSGVSGALFVVVPGQFGLAVYSPRIDSHGHSVRGRVFVEKVVERLGISLFTAPAAVRSLS